MTDRGLSTTLGYAIGLGITTLLISGLLISGGTFVEQEESQAIRTELRVQGQTIAADIAATDRTGATVRNGSFSVRQQYVDTVVNKEYGLDVRRVGDTPTYEITLRTLDEKQETTVRTYSESPVFAAESVRGGKLEYEVNTALQPKVLVTAAGDGFRFHERDGLVVLEAEAPLGSTGGNGVWKYHSWSTFEDVDASGRTGITTYPNESSDSLPAGGTGDAKTGPRLDYTVEFERTGTYWVWVRMKAPSTDPGRSDSVHVALDNQTTPPTYGGIGLSTGSTTWDWTQSVSGGTSEVTVDVSSPGEHTINLWMREDGTQVDTIVLVHNDTYDPGADPVPSAWWSA